MPRSLNIVEFEAVCLEVRDHEDRRLPTFTVRALLHNSDESQDTIYSITLGDMSEADDALDLAPLITYFGLEGALLSALRAKLKKLDPIATVLPGDAREDLH
jgi:hypothetical protein